MASPRRCQHKLIKVAITTFVLITLLMVRLSTSDDEVMSSRNFKSKKMVIGSRPPTCVNKCLSCKPCIATLVIHTRQDSKGVISENEIKSNDYGGNNHDSYYLVSWKCKCGNKFSQP